MKKIMPVAIVAILVLFSACEDKEENTRFGTKNGTVNTLKICTNMEGLKTRSTLSAFPNQAEIGLFITSGSLGNPYDANVGKTSALFVGGGWIMPQPFYLTANNAKIFAYYPYNSANNNGAAIPVDHVSQTDYLYGTHENTINNQSTTAVLTLKHALSLVRFKFRKINYTGEGKLTAISINDGGNAYFSHGTLNIQSGIMTFDTQKKEPCTLQKSEGICNIGTDFPADESVFPSLLSMPCQIEQTGKVVFSFTIDNVAYTINVPVTQWQPGYQYTYGVSLSGKEIIIGSVTIQDWINTSDQNVNI